MRDKPKMSYQFYKDSIAKKIANSDLGHLNNFCAGVMNRMLAFIDDKSRADLNYSRKQVGIDPLMQMVRLDSVNWIIIRQIKLKRVQF